jgi:hypothetical protein
VITATYPAPPALATDHEWLAYELEECEEEDPQYDQMHAEGLEIDREVASHPR